MISITNDAGIPFNVRIVRAGERYGLNDCLTHRDPAPMVEFYDAREHAMRGKGCSTIKERGHFVSRYYVHTLLDDAHFALAPGQGLNLCGYEPAYSIDGTTMDRVRAYLAAEIPLRVEPTFEDDSE